MDKDLLSLVPQNGGQVHFPILHLIREVPDVPNTLLLSVRDRGALPPLRQPEHGREQALQPDRPSPAGASDIRAQLGGRTVQPFLGPSLSMEIN